MAELAVWAPNASRVRLWLRRDSRESTFPMTPRGDGWWRVQVGDSVDGFDYGFLLDDDEKPLPDPRSRRQPEGVHGPSRSYEDTFVWTDPGWLGKPLPGAVFYELHVGTFTTEGTFDAAIERLDHLVDLGITHVELLPVNDFNGVWNWGYDGVLWYAVHEAYGGPDGLKRFVDTSHAKGLAVTLDVVYNHLGPSGNYLPRFGPYLKPGRSTWGDLINLDGDGSDPVRAYIIDNALMWFSEFHVDALRLDAVHALHDSSHTHLLAELSERAQALGVRLGRTLTLIAESDLNDPVMVTPRSSRGLGMDAQWDDDVHHALHAMLTGERQGYYCDFGTVAVLAKVLTEAFLHDGTYSSFRGRRHGQRVDRAAVPGYRFVVCLQNHDQVGNRAAGDRLPEVAPRPLLEVGAVLLLTSPFTPLLWMGEEWAASTRWPFFTSHPEPELSAATGPGRIEEFSDHGWDASQMVDPQDPAAFRESKLDWSELADAEHASMCVLYRTLLRLRRDESALSDPRLDSVRVDFDEAAKWLVVHRGSLRVVANLAQAPQYVPVGGREIVLITGSEQALLGVETTLMPARSAAVLRA